MPLIYRDIYKMLHDIQREQIDPQDAMIIIHLPYTAEYRLYLTLYNKHVENSSDQFKSFEISIRYPEYVFNNIFRKITGVHSDLFNQITRESYIASKRFHGVNGVLAGGDYWGNLLIARYRLIYTPYGHIPVILKIGLNLVGFMEKPYEKLFSLIRWYFKDFQAMLKAKPVEYIGIAVYNVRLVYLARTILGLPEETLKRKTTYAGERGIAHIYSIDKLPILDSRAVYVMDYYDLKKTYERGKWHGRK